MTDQVKHILIGTVGGSVLTGLIFWMFSRDVIESVNVEVEPGKTIKVALQGRKINDTVLLNSLWASDYTRDGMVGWLRKKDIYSIKDPAIFVAMKRSGDPDKFINEAKKMDEQAKPAFASIPNYAVPHDTAYVWKNSPYKNKLLTFANDAQDMELKIVCMDARGAKKISDTGSDASFHLNAGDFEKLLGPGKRQGNCWITVN